MYIGWHRCTVINRLRAMVTHLIPQVTRHLTVTEAVVTAVVEAVAAVVMAATGNHLLTQQDHLLEAAQAHRMVVDQGLQIPHNHPWGMIHPRDGRYFP